MVLNKNPISHLDAPPSRVAQDVVGRLDKYRDSERCVSQTRRLHASPIAARQVYR